MMASKAKVVGQKEVISDYKMRRMGRLKRNADFMKAKGHSTLANKIYQEKAQTQLQTLRDVGLSSDEDEDEDDLEYIGEEEGDENEAEISNNVGNSSYGSKNCNMKASKHPKKTLVCPPNNVGSMAENIKLPLPKIIQSSTKSGTMAEYLEKYEKSNVHQTTKSRSNQQVVGHHECASSATCEKQNQVQQPMKKHVQEPVIPPKRQQVKKKFFSPGAMSAYRDLRKKQMGNVIAHSDVERNDVAHEPEINCTDATEGGSESELQVSGTKRLTVNEGEPSAQELEIQPTTESPIEASKMKKTRGPTKMDKAHVRTLNERPVIVLNKFGQPVGPSKEFVNEFILFLGTLAKDSERASLNFVKWPNMERRAKEKIWEYVLTKYMVPEQCKKWVIGKIGINWRIYKCKTKKSITMHMRPVKRDRMIVHQQFQSLNTNSSSNIGIIQSLRKKVRKIEGIGSCWMTCTQWVQRRMLGYVIS